MAERDSMNPARCADRGAPACASVAPTGALGSGCSRASGSAALFREVAELARIARAELGDIIEAGNPDDDRLAALRAVLGTLGAAADEGAALNGGRRSMPSSEWMFSDAAHDAVVRAAHLRAGV